jgi:gamma-glutamyl-gamma-aminobutyrate hydrolase PuuD
MKKTIGIYAASMGESAFGVSKTYLTFVQAMGCNPRILTPDNMYDDTIDMLLLQGGADLEPKAYGEIPGFYTSNTDVFKQHVYDRCLPNYVEAGKPIFGICLGFQQLASFFGCKLTQNLPYHPYSEPRGKKAHDMFVDLSLTTDFYWGLLEEQKDKNHKPKVTNRVEINSLHHQGLVREDMGADSPLLPIAWAHNEEYPGISGKEIIEVIRHKTLPIAGVQFHPEERDTIIVQGLVKNLLGE